MIAPRRYLPSVTALMCFEAVARLGSATLAATELALTQSAVSRQLRTLEDQLSVQLLERQGRGLALTVKGRDYAVEVREILKHLAQASISVQTDRAGGALNLAILPAFGMHWLAPRLRDFALMHPEVTVNLSTRLAPFEFRTNTFDAAIHFGREDWPDVEFLPLMPEIVVPVCAPHFLSNDAPEPRDLLEYPLLHLDTRPRGWSRWFGGFDIDVPLAPGMVFDQFSTMAQGAIHGLGIALLPTFFAQPYLADGQLVIASDHTSESIGSYYLVWPQHTGCSQALSSFKDWIATQAETT